MSRVLDAKTKRLLDKGDGAAAFDAISQALRPLASGDVREIEILWLGYQFDEGSSSYLVEDGRAVGVSKLGLVQAFFFARHILSRHLAGRTATRNDATATTNTATSAGDDDDDDNDDAGNNDNTTAHGDDYNGGDQLLLDATAVMLLLDAEHLTAANTRKRILRRHVRRYQLDAACAPEEEEEGEEEKDTTEHRRADAAAAAAKKLGALIRRERQVVDGLLTSRLHRHTKSPTLWSHRRWLLTLTESLGVGLGNGRLEAGGGGGGGGGGARRGARKVQTREVLDEMREVVAVAADRHPRNYYAWGHARFLVGFLFGRTEAERGVLRGGKGHDSGSDADGGGESGQGEEEEEEEEEGDVDSIIRFVKDWCVKHHNDISGWSFLYFLLSQLRDQSPSSLPPPPSSSSSSPPPPQPSPAVKFEAGSSYAGATFQGVMDLTRTMRWANESVWVFLATLVGDGLVGERGRAELLQVGRDLLESSSDDVVAKLVLERWIDRCQENRPVSG